jgi:small subunit ribosomal protein S16
MYRLAVQESRRHPSSGAVISYIGSYDPHTKVAKIQVETAQKFLDNGAQPSPRVIKLLKDAGVKMPKWVKSPADKTSVIRHADKLRKNQPAAEVAVEEAAEIEEVAEEVAVPEATEVAAE